MILVNEPLLSGNEEKYLLECIRTGWISSEGPFVSQFEEKFAQEVGRKYGIAVANGTGALDIAVEAIGIGPGDEVIMPAFTIISCISQIIRSGATPVLIDSDPVTWNMDVDQIEDKIASRTKAIMVVHIYGLPVDMDPVIGLADRYKLKIIEDAAEMIGQSYRNMPCGSFGDLSTFSFYANKHITTGEGGMIVTDDAELAEACRSLRNLCFQSGKRFVHERLGWNYRMTNLQAAIGLAQLERLDEFVAKKKQMGKHYREGLETITTLQLPLPKTDYADNIYWVYGLVLDDNLQVKAEETIRKLTDMGVGCRPFFYPMHLQPVLRKLGLFEGENYPHAERLYERGFYIPSGLALTGEQIDTVISKIKELLS